MRAANSNCEATTRARHFAIMDRTSSGAPDDFVRAPDEIVRDTHPMQRLSWRALTNRKACHR